MSEIIEAKTRLAAHHQTKPVESDEGESKELEMEWLASFCAAAQAVVAMSADYRVEIATNYIGLGVHEFIRLGPRPPESVWDEHDYHNAEAIALADRVAMIMRGAADEPLDYYTLEGLAKNGDVSAKLFLGYIEGRITRARSRYVSWAVEQTLCILQENYEAVERITEALMERAKLVENELQAIYKDCNRVSENKWDNRLWQKLSTGLARFERLNGPLRV